MSFRFFADTYATERLKTLAVWSQFGDGDLEFRPEPRARTPREHFLHQCLSEDTWFSRMLGIVVSLPALPERETRLDFLEHYARASAERADQLQAMPDSWFDEPTSFFDVSRSRAWVVLRRIAHSAHHRGQLTTYLRLLGRALYSTYGPTADTGGLFTSAAPVIYRYETVDRLLGAERRGGEWPPLPDVRGRAVTERP
jgi:uncharacterized damage-inducible protein DinB